MRRLEKNSDRDTARRARRAAATAALGALAVIVLSCTAPGPPGESARFEDRLVSANALSSATGRLLIVDSRPRAEYDAGHVPGSVPYDTDQVARMQTRGLEPYVRDNLLVALETLGLEATVPIAVVDNGTRDGFARAAETCWHVALVSAAECHVLEGGIDAWRASGEEIVTSPPPARDPRPVTMTPRPRVFADLDWMRDAAFEGRPIIDVQESPDVPSVPGAWRVPLPRLVDDLGRVDRDAIASAVRLAEFARDPKRVVFGTARRDGAAGWYLFGPVAGLDDVRLFAGGMSQWWTVPDLPRTDTVGEEGLGGLR